MARLAEQVIAQLAGGRAVVAGLPGVICEGYSLSMRIEELEAAVRLLSPEGRAAFREWFAEFDAQEWNRQLEADVATGRLDWLIDEAREDRQAGRCTDR